MRVTVRILLGDSRKPKEEIQFDTPERPATVAAGGRWVWVGPLPSKWVDLGDGYTLGLRVVRSASVRQWHAQDVPPDQFKCDRCDRSFRTKKGLDFHARMHEEGRVPRRKLPGTPDARLLKAELPSATQSDTRKHKCADCGQEFDTPSALGGHRKVHRGERTRPPDQKKSPFSTSVHYNQSCDMCDRTDLSLRGLLSHKRVVHGVLKSGEKAEPVPERSPPTVPAALKSPVQTGPTVPPSARTPQVVGKVLATYFGGKSPITVANQIGIHPLVVADWVVRAYRLMDVERDEAGGVNPRAVAMYEELGEDGRKRLAERVLKGEG